jgi:nucleoside-diphosphate-sugar epimerase
MKRVMVTGATGFIGANLTRRLLNDGYEIFLLVRPGYFPQRIHSIIRDVHHYEIDFLDKESLQQIVKQVRPDWVFHLAAFGAYSWQTDMMKMIQTNIIATINLVETCLHTGFEVFINTGSSSEYGFKSIAPSETEWLEPNSPYAITKSSASQFCRYTAHTKNVRLNTLRLYSVYGPYEEPKRLIPSLIRFGMQGKIPPLVNPDTARDYIFVDDVVEAYILLASTPAQELGAIYNVGSGIQTLLRDVVQTACQEFGIIEEPQWGTMPPRIWDTGIWVANNQKLRNELGWHPQTTFPEGFRKMVQWYSDNLNFLDY